MTISSNSLNDTLRLASIWCALLWRQSFSVPFRPPVLGHLVCYCSPCRHSLHAIAVQLAPAPGCTGIELLRADTFDLHCFQTLTGTKFLVVVEPDTPDVEALLRETCAPLLLSSPACSCSDGHQTPGWPRSETFGGERGAQGVSSLSACALSHPAAYVKSLMGVPIIQLCRASSCTPGLRMLK